jgi:hypothetical protein
VKVWHFLKKIHENSAPVPKIGERSVYKQRANLQFHHMQKKKKKKKKRQGSFSHIIRVSLQLSHQKEPTNQNCYSVIPCNILATLCTQKIQQRQPKNKDRTDIPGYAHVLTGITLLSLTSLLRDSGAVA